MALRKPFIPPTGSVMGDTGHPGMAMPPQVGRGGAQPTMPMAGAPQGQPLPMSGAAPMAPNAGGPTSPLNIAQMLQAKVQMPGTPPAQPGAPPMPPWGDAGTRPPMSGMGDQQEQPDSGPKRVPFALGDMMGGAGAQPPTGADPNAFPVAAGMAGGAAGGPEVMMRLLKTLGRV